MVAHAGKREILHFALIAVIRSLAMSRYRPVFHLALAAAILAALGLAGCGRKGPLDPPPGASLAGEPQADMPGLTSSKGRAPPAAAAQAPKKHFPLDGLLN
jgi:predicted small lipoprotein YifL